MRSTGECVCYRTKTCEQSPGMRGRQPDRNVPGNRVSVMYQRRPTLADTNQQLEVCGHQKICALFPDSVGAPNTCFQVDWPLFCFALVLGRFIVCERAINDSHGRRAINGCRRVINRSVSYLLPVPVHPIPNWHSSKNSTRPDPWSADFRREFRGKRSPMSRERFFLSS